MSTCPFLSLTGPDQYEACGEERPCPVPNHEKWTEGTGYRLRNVSANWATVVWRNTGTTMGCVRRGSDGWVAVRKGEHLGPYPTRSAAVEAVWLAETGLKPSTEKGA